MRKAFAKPDPSARSRAYHHVFADLAELEIVMPNSVHAAKMAEVRKRLKELVKADTDALYPYMR